MIRLSSGPRDHTRQATANARAPRKITISRRLQSVQVSLFFSAAAARQVVLRSRMRPVPFREGLRQVPT